MSTTRLDLPEPETPVMPTKQPSGKRASTSCRLLARQPLSSSQRRFLALRRLAGTGMARMPERYWPVSEAGSAITSVGRALGHDHAAMHAGARPHVDQMVGRADRVLVVLDHDHRVAEVAQVAQRLQQPVVVALVQADRRLVQHVEHAGQPRADLRGQADALALAAGQRAAVAGQRQVGQARPCRGSPAARGSP